MSTAAKYISYTKMVAQKLRYLEFSLKNKITNVRKKKQTKNI